MDKMVSFYRNQRLREGKAREVGGGGGEVWRGLGRTLVMLRAPGGQIRTLSPERWFAIIFKKSLSVGSKWENGQKCVYIYDMNNHKKNEHINNVMWLPHKTSLGFPAFPARFACLFICSTRN